MKRKLLSTIALLGLFTLTSCNNPAPSSSSASSASSSSSVETSNTSSNEISSSIASTSSIGSSTSVSSTSSEETSSSVTSSSSEESSSSVESSSSSFVEDISVSITGETTMDEQSTLTLTATVAGTTNQDVVWTSSKPTVATIAPKGTIITTEEDIEINENVVTALNVNENVEVVFTAVSVADSTKIATHTVTIVAADQIKGSIVISTFDANEPIETIVENTGAYRIRVDVENLPEGKTIDDCEFIFPKLNDAMVFITDAPGNANWAKNERQFIVNYAGVVDIDVDVTVDGKTGTIHRDFEITKNESLYTDIATPEAFIEMLNNPTGSRYSLSENLDLGGYVHNATDINTVFQGILDGNGHTVSNFTVACGVSGVGAGIFKELGRGIVRNIHLIGDVNAPLGFGGLVAHTIQYQAIVENSLFEANNISKVVDNWSWQRNGVIAGCNKGLVRNVVAINASTSTDEVYRNQMISTVPYGYRNETDAKFALVNVYTNIADRALAVPFDASGFHEWGMVGNEDANINVVYGLNDFSITPLDAIDLDTTVWTVAAGTMPYLAHFGETAIIKQA